VLSNADDRAWYDSHKDQILKGKNTEEMKEEDMSYMTKADVKKMNSTSAYKGFDVDKEDNFYRVYRDFFLQMDREEELEEEMGTEHRAAPAFGDNLSTAEEVFAFYRYWSGFATAKQFTYADMYNPNEAPNRRIKRIIEDENKKERNKERKEFNNQVQQLLDFLKSKDTRYIKFRMEEDLRKKEHKRRVEEEKEAKREAEREKMKKYKEELAAYY